MRNSFTRRVWWLSSFMAKQYECQGAISSAGSWGGCLQWLTITWKLWWWRWRWWPSLASIVTNVWSLLSDCGTVYEFGRPFTPFNVRIDEMVEWIGAQKRLLFTSYDTNRRFDSRSRDWLLADMCSHSGSLLHSTRLRLVYLRVSATKLLSASAAKRLSWTAICCGNCEDCADCASGPICLQTNEKIVFN